VKVALFMVHSGGFWRLFAHRYSGSSLVDS
jgi:hypothetical protein